MAYRIILIRHSIPSIEENTPSIDWSLSAAGETAAINLAEYLVTFSAKEIASSPETKAYQTASLIAGRLGLPVRIDPDLHEHSRSKVGYIARAEFETGIASLLENPHELTFGDESADDVFHRMEQAIARATATGPDGDLMVVSHGTAMSIYIARILNADPLVFWRNLSMPTAIILDGKKMSVIKAKGAAAS